MAYRRSIAHRVTDAIGFRISRLGEYVQAAPLIYNPLTFMSFHRVASYSAPGVAAAFRAVYPNAKRFLDVGSGSGAYAAHLAREGLDVIALEKSGTGRLMARRQGVDCRAFDLSRTPPCTVEGEFDVVYCFEVAEHLTAELGDSLVAFMTSLTSCVVFSAAQPGQLGFGHVNCQTKEYWIERFEMAGFGFREDRTDQVQRVLRDEEVIYWLIDNVMVLERGAR